MRTASDEYFVRESRVRVTATCCLLQSVRQRAKTEQEELVASLPQDEHAYVQYFLGKD